LSRCRPVSNSFQQVIHALKLNRTLGRGFPSAPLLTRVASQNLAVGRRFPSSWGLHFSRASSKEHPSRRFNSQFERRPFGASSYHISSVLVQCRFSDVPMRIGSPYLAELLDAMLVSRGSGLCPELLEYGCKVQLEVIFSYSYPTIPSLRSGL
ncbi:hypothetical protein T03_3027, partial [Trichinella britovi]